MLSPLRISEYVTTMLIIFSVLTSTSFPFECEKLKIVNKAVASNSKAEIAKRIMVFKLKELRLKRELMKFML
jgi:hypothetical protein